MVPVTGVSDRGEAALSEQPPDKQPETGIVILYHGCHKNECRTIRFGDLGDEPVPHVEACTNAMLAAACMQVALRS